MLFVTAVLSGYYFLAVDPIPSPSRDVLTLGFREKTLFPTHSSLLSVFAQCLSAAWTKQVCIALKAEMSAPVPCWPVTKDEINVPIALSAVRDGGPVTTAITCP